MENTAIIRNVRGQVRPLAGRRGGSVKPLAKRTGNTGRNGFLKHGFLPFWAFSGNKGKAEKEFFCSLIHLCVFYDLLVPDVSAYVFPQTIFWAWEITSARIKAIDKHLDCIILQDDTHTATLATVKQLNTGHNLYYVPVRPLWKWGQSAKYQSIAEVVTVIFAYLRQVVRIPFYAENGTYLNYQYDTLFEWLANADDEDVDDEDESEDARSFREHQLDTLYLMQNAGLHMLTQIDNPAMLGQMETVITAYADREDKDLEWALLAISFLQLYQQYPGNSVFDNIRPDILHPYEEERIFAEQYISFYWSANDCFCDDLNDLVNTNLLEMCTIDEPIAIKVFDTPDNAHTPDFGFETRLLALLNELSQLLTHYDYEEREPSI